MSTTTKVQVLVYWLEERQWSVINETAVRGVATPGIVTEAKFQGKYFPTIILASEFVSKYCLRFLNLKYAIIR